MVRCIDSEKCVSNSLLQYLLPYVTEEKLHETSETFRKIRGAAIGTAGISQLLTLTITITQHSQTKQTTTRAVFSLVIVKY